MPLPSVAVLQSYTDKLAVSYERLLAVAGTSSGSVVAGTWRSLSSNLVDLLTECSDIDHVLALAQDAKNLLDTSNVERIFTTQYAIQPLSSLLDSLQKLIADVGPDVDASIVSMSTFLSYYNGGSGGAKFSSLLHPSFGTLWNLVRSEALPAAGLFHPGIHPSCNATTYPSGYGTRAVGGSFSAGASASYLLYSEPLPFVEVTTTFSGGSAHPVITVTGTDDLAATAQTWTADLGADNPASALSTTLGASQTADSKSSRLVADSTGFVVGSVVVVGSGTVNQETAVVLAVADGTHLTLELRNAHASGETVTAKLAVALTPTITGRRIRTVSGITIGGGGGGHAAGAVRVVGSPLRMGNPVN